MTNSRREFILGLGASVVAGPALAQLNLNSLVNSAAQVAGALSMSEDDEIKMGQTYYEPYLTKSGGRYQDRNLQEALQKFSANLFTNADKKKFPWEVTLVDNKTVNAWALPGGKIAVNSALVRYCNDPAELASVMAHEIGHADLGHGAKQVRNQAIITSVGGLGKQAVLGWLGGSPLGAEVLTALEAPVYQLILTGYSRQNEFEADNHILGMFQKTGYDPGRAADFFKTLKRLYPDSSSETTSLFSTHPGTQDRINKLTESSKSLPRPASDPKVPGWAELKMALPTPASITG